MDVGRHKAAHTSGVLADEVKLDQGFVTVRMRMPELAVTQAHHPFRFLQVFVNDALVYDYGHSVVFSAR
ncbi:MAG: hypothetical protein QM647_15595 [Asticcacaulis sp.]|uniref:hypothetical protein n=1 Tax=Asticcacaulis sp. TaxID=1872648 RepID=UPI0039E5E35E